ncbi:hypothetical protein SLEP1_g34752 [Rubroshorea leprosula]|uniref:Uncharacterized protein n=1 Tax=Rubroshorea leprosula TaxID=152421 RepID=A0AAV5KL00_9ROSI|nr:hypothetical protein SLEP1_g34752 [Rubroshorea leprosula]
MNKGCSRGTEKQDLKAYSKDRKRTIWPEKQPMDRDDKKQRLWLGFVSL